MIIRACCDHTFIALAWSVARNKITSIVQSIVTCVHGLLCDIYVLLILGDTVLTQKLPSIGIGLLYLREHITSCSVSSIQAAVDEENFLRETRHM